MIQKLLIANRGEIAVRIIRACREMGIATVAVYSTADRNALHTQLADEAICIGGNKSSDSYLNMESIISAAVVTGADAIHPGFGFLSENTRFAEICCKCGIVFVGPSAEVLASMGNKSVARRIMTSAGIPTIPGTEEEIYEYDRCRKVAEEIGYPVIIKAALGGGGKGMRVAHSPEELERAFNTAQQESLKAFGDATMYVEHFVENPRHIEFQILADSYGNIIHLGERDCSIQRHHQKLIEEAPSVILDDSLRKRMGEVAVAAAAAAGYENAGTIEFLLEENGSFYFMEMNTRIQVEHPVTEAVTGIDLIKAQIRIAEGDRLPYTQEDVAIRGAAMECRLNATRPGLITDIYLPGGNGVRIDSALYAGSEISPFYDSMIAKIIVHGADRQEAIQKMRSALGEIVIEGISTNLDDQYDIINDEVFISGKFDVGFIEEFDSRRS